MTTYSPKSPKDIAQGDQWHHWTYGADGNMPITVESLREPEPWVDRFGRDMLKVWSKRLDTGREGWTLWGETGTVHVIAS